MTNTSYRGVVFDECWDYKNWYHHFKKVYSPAFETLHAIKEMAGVSDLELYLYACRDDLIIVTCDRDFKGLDDDRIIFQRDKRKMGQLEKQLHRKLIG